MKRTHFRTTICLTALLALCLSSANAFAKGDSEGRGKRHKRPDFTTLDLNTDSVITLEEFSQHEIPRGDHETIFNHIDADGDGSITTQEFEDHKPPRKNKGKRDDR